MEISKKMYKILKMDGASRQQILRKNRITPENFVLIMREYASLTEYTGLDFANENYKLCLNEEGRIVIENYKSKMKPILHSKIAIIISIVSLCLSVGISLLLRFI